MDTASKAIIIAGGFLIAILIITMFMYMLTSFRDFQSQSDAARERIETNAFNSLFSEYIYSKDGNYGNTIKGDQLFNLVGLIAEQNSKTDNISYITLNGTQVDDTTVRDNYFYFTETLENNYIIQKVDYSGGAISNIQVVDESGTSIDF